MNVRTVNWLLVIVGVVCLTMLLQMLFFPLGTGHSASLQTYSLSNLKQLALSVDIYENDNDGRFPPQVSSPWAARTAIGPYVKNDSILSGTNKQSPEYLGNSSVAGKEASKLPPRTVVFFESAPWPDGRRAVSFADGSARRLTEAQFQQAVRDGWVWNGK